MTQLACFYLVANNGVAMVIGKQDSDADRVGQLEEIERSFRVAILVSRARRVSELAYG